MAKITVTTGEGEVICVIPDSDLPTKRTALSSADLMETIWDALTSARELDSDAL